MGRIGEGLDAVVFKRDVAGSAAFAAVFGGFISDRQFPSARSERDIVANVFVVVGGMGIVADAAGSTFFVAIDMDKVQVCRAVAESGG